MGKRRLKRECPVTQQRAKWRMWWDAELPEPAPFEQEDVVDLRRKLAGLLGREEDGIISQDLLANILGTTRTAVSSWERGTKKPSGSTRRLMELLLFDSFAKSLLSKRGSWRVRLKRKSFLREAKARREKMEKPKGAK